ncbi:minor capsid protein [Helcococcus sueciensis]|uniref:minor capsid protein n=1 Tax=Helcococcus sueciensis TaxID=241555 RepID=UPI00146EF49C|nr:minor capsid protein [Helcococcus sueciensis]
MRMKKAHDKATVSMVRVNKAYDNSLSRLKKEIRSLTKEFDGMKPEEIRDFLNGHISYDRYNEWLQIYKTTKDKAVKKEMEKLIKANATGFRIRRKEAMLRDIEMERLAMTGSQLDNFGSHLRNVYKSTLNETGFKGVNKNLIDEAMKHNWAGSNYSKRVWHNNKVLAKRIETNLFESFISGKSNKQIVDELESLTNLGRHAANRLVRTETSYMVNSADLESSKQRGIKAKKFEATLDSRTSKVCRRHNQKIIPIDKIKIGENAPPLHPYCRSFLADVLEGWDYETDEELEELISEEYKGNKELENNNVNIEVNSKDGYNINKDLDLGKQLNHVYGTNEFKQRIKNNIEPSYYNNEIDTIEKVGSKLIGTGELVIDKNNSDLAKEKVISGDNLEAYVVNNITGKKVKTDRSVIRYNKKKGWHMYPDYPRKEK